MLWKSWAALGNVIIVGMGSYVGLLVLQRLSGKRTLSKLNAFDLVVTVALGSALATTMLSSEVALADGIAAFWLLMTLQLAVTFLSVRLPFFKRLVKASPALLVENGRVLPDAMRRERVTEDEVLQAVRASGSSSLHGLHVVLETNGKISVVSVSTQDATAMTNVR